MSQEQLPQFPACWQCPQKVQSIDRTGRTQNVRMVVIAPSGRRFAILEKLDGYNRVEETSSNALRALREFMKQERTGS